MAGWTALETLIADMHVLCCLGLVLQKGIFLTKYGNKFKSMFPNTKSV